MSDTLLKIEDLKIEFRSGRETVQPIRGVNFYLKKGETLGVVGESGSGKSVTSLAVMGLLPPKTSRIASGKITYDGKDLTTFSDRQFQKIRGNDISMIFQEPMTSLNPVFTIGQQLSEPLRQHKNMNKQQMEEAIINVLKQVGIPRAEQIIHEYPHQLSGGMRQRVMISMALLCEPKLMIADEPTTALDVTIQAQILELMKKIREETDMSLLLITHDLGVVAEMCDRVVVMYAGEVVEMASTKELFDDPRHPYTQGLIQSLPSNNDRKDRLYSIRGQVPKPGEITKGCIFANRCPLAFDKCFAETPPVIEADGRMSKCWLQAPEEKEVNSVD